MNLKPGGATSDVIFPYIFAMYMESLVQYTVHWYIIETQLLYINITLKRWKRERFFSIDTDIYGCARIEITVEKSQLYGNGVPVQFSRLNEVNPSFMYIK